MAAPVRHRVELDAVRKLHLVFVEKVSELALCLFSSPSFVRLCFPLGVGDKGTKLDAVASVSHGRNILPLDFCGRQCIGLASDLARSLCDCFVGSTNLVRWGLGL